MLLPDREDCHPLGCHNPRIADEAVFDRLVQSCCALHVDEPGPGGRVLGHYHHRVNTAAALNESNTPTTWPMWRR